jgi:hypothetical protein
MSSCYKKDMEKLIPPGKYCYIINYTKTSSNFKDEIPVVYCPYRITKEINKVRVPWCSFLNKGGIGDYYSEEDWSRLVKYFGGENNLFNFLSLDRLGDNYKECGFVDDYTEEEAIEWINKIKSNIQILMSEKFVN